MEYQIPLRIQRLFWDMRKSSLDAHTHAETIIERVINNGTLADWRWLVATYGKAEIRKRLHTVRVFGRDAVRPEARHIASLIIK